MKCWARRVGERTFSVVLLGNLQKKKGEENSVVGRIASNQINTLIPVMRDYVMLHGKRKCTDVIKIMDLKTETVLWTIKLGPVSSHELLEAKNFSKPKSERYGRRGNKTQLLAES